MAIVIEPDREIGVVAVFWRVGNHVRCRRLSVYPTGRSGRWQIRTADDFTKPWTIGDEFADITLANKRLDYLLAQLTIGTSS